MTNINTGPYWDNKWEKERDSYTRDSRRVKMAELVCSLVPPDAKVLDIGGGYSFVPIMLSKDHDVTVIDISPYAVSQLEAIEISAIEYDIDRYRSRIFGEFDIVLCLEVLEHVTYPQKAVQCALNHAPKAIFSVPNNCMPPGQCHEHMRTYDENSLRKELGQYKTVKVTETGLWLVAETEKE